MKEENKKMLYNFLRKIVYHLEGDYYDNHLHAIDTDEVERLRNMLKTIFEIEEEST